jgi:hypothetical protein
MEEHDLSTESISLSRLTTRNVRQLYRHKLQWFRTVLSLAAALNLTPNICKLYWHYRTHHKPSVLPDFLAFSLSFAARITWVFLFRDPAVFLRFKRPGRGYKWMVCATLVLTTVPNSLIHIWALKMALKNDTIVLTGIMTSILAMVFLVLPVGLVVWMAWRFLLDFAEKDEDFEPTVNARMVAIEGERQQLAHAIELYTDDISLPSTRTMVSTGYLSQAYEEQRHEQHSFITSEPQPPFQGSSGVLVTTVREEIYDGEDEELNTVTSTSTTDVANPSRCQTTARFDYLQQSNSGPHSWFLYPLIPLILSSYATILLFGLPLWIREDRQYKLRTSSP